MRIPRLESRPVGARLAVVTALLAATSLALAGPASANVGEEIIIRCGHVESLSGFSQSAYDQALKELEADAEEYSPCAAQIHAAQRAAAAAGAGGGGAQGAAGAQSPNQVAIAPTPSQRRAITHAEHAGAEPVKLGGRTLHPGVVHVDVASALSSLPTPLLVVMAFLLACALALAGGKLAKRVRDGRSD
jgi:hypothetical protein